MRSPAGWYPDPTDEEAMLRWWDGERWGDHVRARPNRSSKSAWRTVMIVTAVVGFIGVSFIIAVAVLASMAHGVKYGNK
jgi:Protein of unknown function (DUF2510)